MKWCTTATEWLKIILMCNLYYFKCATVVLIVISIIFHVMSAYSEKRLSQFHRVKVERVVSIWSCKTVKSSKFSHSKIRNLHFWDFCLKKWIKISTDFQSSWHFISCSATNQHSQLFFLIFVHKATETHQPFHEESAAQHWRR